MMNFPLNHAQCQTLESQLIALRDAAVSSEDFATASAADLATHEAYRTAINLLHEARMAAAQDVIARRRKTLGLRITR